MNNFKKKNVSLFRRSYNFISRVSNGSVLQSSSLTTGSVPKELKDIGLEKPEVAKVLLDKALKEKSLSTAVVDIDSQEFRDEVNRRVVVKNIKQKVAFIVGSVPMFKTLQDISVATALNPGAQMALSLSLYFGISMPSFIALHIAEHTLPLSIPRTAVKCTKIMVGISFCVMSECVDKVGSVSSKILNVPDTSLDMQGTIGVPSDVKLQDVLTDMERWGDENSEILKGLSELYNLQRKTSSNK